MKGKPAKHILAALAGAALLSGCTREAEPSAPVVLTSVLEQTYTRTAYDGTLGKLTWTEGDQVAVHVGDSYQTSEVTPSDGHLAVSETASAYRNYFAVYPASAADAGNYGNPTLKVNLPASYDISDIVSGASAIRTSDFSPCPMVAVNDTYDSMLRFYHVGGLLRITLTGVKPATKTVTVTFDKDVTGSYAVSDPATDHPTITTGETATNNVVTFTVTSGRMLGPTATPIVLNVPVPCGTYNSVTVATLDDGGAPLASQTYDREPLVFLRHHGKKLAFGELTVDFVLGTLSDASVPYPGGDGSFAESFVSYKTSDGGATKMAVPFTLEYSEDGGETWSTTTPSWLSDAPAGGIHAGSATGEAMVVTAKAQVNSASDPHHDALVAKGSYTTAKDLSSIDVSTGATVSRTTANCYVVDRPGKYKFPLVYGNGVDWTKNTTTGINEDAFRAKAGVGATSYRPDNGATNYLGRFKDHLDNNILSPYIATQQSGKTMEAILVWQDVRGLVTVDSEISGSGQNAYITFSVPAETITQGNALIALLVDDDSDGTPETIAWSWHVWVTEEDLTAVKAASNGNFLAPVNIGWCEGRTETYNARSCQMRATQDGSGLIRTVTLTQTAGSVITGGNSPYYQWGRKDPLQASSGVSNTSSFKIYYPSTSFYAPVISAGTVSIGSSIQFPYCFYTNSSGEWCSTNYYNPWSSTINGTGPDENANARTKTVYDPSPVGYRVPSLDAWDGFDASNFTWGAVNGDSGRIYTPSSLFIPASGNRSMSSGGVFSIGSLGYYWSASPSATGLGGGDLLFGSDSVNPSSGNFRAGGVLVRCVKE